MDIDYLDKELDYSDKQDKKYFKKNNEPLKKRLKILTKGGLRGYRTGDIIDVEVDKKGNIIDPYWNARFKESLKNKCICFIDDD